MVQSQQDVSPGHGLAQTRMDGVEKNRIRVKNRRKFYLDRHPSYFTQPELELADPLLYDRCVRRFQSPAEREADGRSKGFSGSLEADLYRSEAKLAALTDQSHSGRDENVSSKTRHVSYIRDADGQIIPEDQDEIPNNKEEGMQRWKDEMTLRFLRGEDPDLSYEEIDTNEEFDVIEDREAEDKWFDTESPSWIEDKDLANGETGIQDF